MKLTLEQIKQITLGAVEIEQTPEGIRFHRFTREQEKLYLERSMDFYRKTPATAGVKLLMRTNSSFLRMEVALARASSRSYNSFDVHVNGKPVGYLDNFSAMELPEAYSVVEYPETETEKTFDLGPGEKEVTVYFPWSAIGILKTLELEEGSSLQALRPAKKLLAFGDSITQGYDALRPSARYAAHLAEFLGAEEINKAIGGETFFPGLAGTKENFVPDYILVAYGTNDWSHGTEPEFLENCRGFFKNLSKNYPNSRIFALTPIWRKDHRLQKVFGAFEKVEQDIRLCTQDIANVTVIRGYDFLPHDETLFGDLYLHPNDRGFAFYAESIIQEVQKLL